MQGLADTAEKPIYRAVILVTIGMFAGYASLVLLQVAVQLALLRLSGTGYTTNTSLMLLQHHLMGVMEKNLIPGPPRPDGGRSYGVDQGRVDKSK